MRCVRTQLLGPAFGSMNKIPAFCHHPVSGESCFGQGHISVDCEGWKKESSRIQHSLGR